VLTYILITLCLSLAGVAGLQMMYMFYLDRLDRDKKKRLHELEIRCRDLANRLSDAEAKITEQEQLIEALYTEPDDGEVWADVLDDR
jgi:hypothetical protein